VKHILITTIAVVVLVGCGGPSVPDPDGALAQACIDGNIGAVKRHMAAGTNVNAKNKYGWTPLYWASSSGHKEVVELLIANGAYVNPIADVGDTPLDGAIKYKQNETADLLRKHGGKTGIWLRAGESIHVATSAGHIEAVKHHLAAGTDVNAKDYKGMTPLHKAAWNGHTEVAELLIAKGADVNAKCESGISKGQTPLDQATGKTADLLRKHGGKTGEELRVEAGL
jgi:ankyrin repeat protein